MAPKRKRPSSKDGISGSSAKATKSAVAVEDESMAVADTENKSTTLFFRRRNTAPKRNKRSPKAAVEEEDEGEPTAVVDSDDELMSSFVRRAKVAPKPRKRSTKDKNSKSFAKPKRRFKAVENGPVVGGEPETESTARFLDEPIADSEARSTWPQRYLLNEVSHFWTKFVV